MKVLTLFLLLILESVLNNTIVVNANKVVEANNHLTSVFDQFLDNRVSQPNINEILKTRVFRQGWQLFKNANQKVYENILVEKRRMKIFLNNVVKIKKHNMNPSKTYVMGVNEFADLSSDEFQNQYGRSEMINEVEDICKKKITRQLSTKAPVAYDTRMYNYISIGREQQKCKCGYAFASVAVLEALYSKKFNRTVPLSVQQILDCSQSSGNNGCSGGNGKNTFEFIQENGIAKEDDYPYEAICPKKQTCKKKKHIIKDLRMIPIDKNEETIKNALLMYGPLFTSINTKGLQHYVAGVYYSENCSQTGNHAVAIVGYGVLITEDDTELEFWTVKNSWSLNWGLRGYHKMVRNMNNTCGIGITTYAVELK